MAKQTTEFAVGVSQATFDTHKHNYVKATQLCCDADDKWGSPVCENTVDDGQCHVTDSPSWGDTEAWGMVTATNQMSVPI